MNYAKPPLTLEQQADLLLSRGLFGDKPLMMDRLAMVNYYRLSGYWHPFRLQTLLAEYPDIPVVSMGFPPDWQLCPVWK
ncbi:MAG: hypothetical protein JW709_06150 [Sedimentisphaerales bacterium]|nr:hypothetical protein [Sedimentisphaerales bacterium]